MSDEVGAPGEVDAGEVGDCEAGTIRSVEPLAAGVTSQDEPVAKTAAVSSTATIVERDTVSAPPAAETFGLALMIVVSRARQLLTPNLHRTGQSVTPERCRREH